MDTGLDALKNASKKVVHKAAEETSEFIGNKIVDAVAKLNDEKILKQKPVINENSRNVEEIIIPREKKRGNIKRIKASIIKIKHHKIFKLLNNSTVSKFVTKMD